jgi:hypothetical protein
MTLEDQIIKMLAERDAKDRLLRHQCDAVTDTNEMLDEALAVVKGLLELYSTPEPDSQEDWQAWFDDGAAKSDLWKRAKALVAKHA